MSTMTVSRKHYVGLLTATVVALAAGTGGVTGFLPRWEGMDRVAKHFAIDPPGVITVCHGHTNFDDPKLKAGDVYTAAMCADLLALDLPKYNAQLASCLPKDMQVGDRQHVAMLSFVYNVGKGNFCKSSVSRLFREGKRKEACNAMGMFTRANGRVLKGLQNRRYDKMWGEVAWCLRDD